MSWIICSILLANISYQDLLTLLAFMLALPRSPIWKLCLLAGKSHSLCSRQAGQTRGPGYMLIKIRGCVGPADRCDWYYSSNG